MFAQGSLPFLSLTGVSPNTHSRRGARFTVRADTDFYSVLGVSKNATKAEIKSGMQFYFTEFPNQENATLMCSIDVSL
jgi:hypothetical protein